MSYPKFKTGDCVTVKYGSELPLVKGVIVSVRKNFEGSEYIYCVRSVDDNGQAVHKVNDYNDFFMHEDNLSFTTELIIENTSVTNWLSAKV